MFFPRPRLAFWLTVPTGAMVGFFLAMQEFGGRSKFDVSGFVVCGVGFLVIVAAYLIFLRRGGEAGSRIGRVVCVAGCWGALVLLGAATGGGLTAWEIIAAAVILGTYCGAVEIVAVRSEAQMSQKFGAAGWAFSVIAVTACVALTVISFSSHGFAAIPPWASVWITLWISFRSIYCSTLLRGRVNPQVARQLATQLQRGVLLLQGGILTGLIRSQAGAIAFVVAMGLLSACNLLDKPDKRSGN